MPGCKESSLSGKIKIKKDSVYHVVSNEYNHSNICRYLVNYITPSTDYTICLLIHQAIGISQQPIISTEVAKRKKEKRNVQVPDIKCW